MRARPARRRLLASAGAALLALALLAGACGSDEGTPPTPMPAPPEVDVPYGAVTGCGPNDGDCGGSQELDIYRSEEAGPNPVIVWVHGGGFVGGDKAASLSAYAQPLLDDGWDIVAINYRLTTPEGQNRFPTALQDAKRAVRWVKANAAAQDWDPAAVAAMGHSAGGNLVELLAATSQDPALEAPDLPPELAAVDSSVIAEVALAPVTDLATFVQAPMFADAVRNYVGCERRCEEQLLNGSVQPHVGPDAAPVLAVHGADDGFAQPSQGELLQQAYEAAGIGDRFELIVVDDGPEEFRAHELDQRRWMDDIEDFLAEHRPDQG